MNFTTKITIPPVAEGDRLSYTTSVVSMGSCFAAHMQEKFTYYKLPFFSHPFGTLFHPLAIERSLERVCMSQYLPYGTFGYTKPRYGEVKGVAY